MLFDKNDERTTERVLYKTKPNMILGCKNAIYGIVLLAIAFMVSPMAIQFIGKMQVYMISNIQMPLTRYTAIAFFVVILVIILYIIWQLLKWFSIEYTLTDTRIIIKTGLLSTKKNYMPYRTIQDINTSQGILARMFNVGTVSAFSAYDNNQIRLENISNPAKVEEIIFSNMMGYRDFPEPPRSYIDDNREKSRFYENPNDNYYDEYEPITPIGHERNSYPRREYEYYPEEEFSFQQSRSNRYEYEPYGDELEYNVDRVMNTSNENIRYEGSPSSFSNDNIRYEGAPNSFSNDNIRYENSQNSFSNDSMRYEDSPNSFSNDSHYNEVRNNYSNGSRDYYEDNEREFYQRDSDDRTYQQNEQKHVDEDGDSSEKVIRRHFDKFKR